VNPKEEQAGAPYPEGVEHREKLPHFDQVHDLSTKSESTAKEATRAARAAATAAAAKGNRASVSIGH
jgi:hypothetical protein